MKMWKSLACCLLAGVMLFGLAGCGGANFNGKFETPVEGEALTEAVKWVNTAVTGEDGNKHGYFLTRYAGKVTAKGETTVEKGDKKTTVKSEVTSEFKSVGSNDALVKKIKVDANGTKSEVEYYETHDTSMEWNVDARYLKYGDEKIKFDGKADTARFSDFSEVLGVLDSSENMMYQPVMFLNMLETASLGDYGIKVYIDKETEVGGGNQGEYSGYIKVEIGGKALAQMMRIEEKDVTVNAFSVIYVVGGTTSAGLIRAQANVDVTYTMDGVKRTTKLEATVVPSDKTVKLPDVSGFSTLTEEEGETKAEDWFKSLGLDIE